MKNVSTLPFVIANRDGLERQYDIFSLLLKDRIVFINGVIDDFLANSIVDRIKHNGEYLL